MTLTDLELTFHSLLVLGPVLLLDSLVALDGLDELLPEHRSRFLDELATLSCIANIQFLFFARDNSGVQADVDRSFETSGSVPAHFKITGDMTLHDRRIFLQEMLRKHKNARTFNPALRDMILSKLAPSDSTYVIQHS